MHANTLLKQWRSRQKFYFYSLTTAIFAYHGIGKGKEPRLICFSVKGYIFLIYLINKIFVYMFPIAGKTAGPNGLNFLREPKGVLEVT